MESAVSLQAKTKRRANRVEGEGQRESNAKAHRQKPRLTFLHWLARSAKPLITTSCLSASATAMRPSLVIAILLGCVVVIDWGGVDGSGLCSLLKRCFLNSLFTGVDDRGGVVGVVLLLLLS